MTLFLYSTNTKLAHHINTTFYAKKHFVWCTPYSGCTTPPSAPANFHPTSCPKNLYEDYISEALMGKNPASLIANNKIGLIKGATDKLWAGTINYRTFKNILAMIQSSSLQDFVPFLYVIRHDLVQSLLVNVPIAQWASTYWPEFQILALDESAFEVLTICQ